MILHEMYKAGCIWIFVVVVVSCILVPVVFIQDDLIV